MGVMALFHHQKRISFRYFFKKDWYIGFIFYTQVYSHNIYIKFDFQLHFFAKCLSAGEDDPEKGHLCHIDTFLVDNREKCPRISIKCSSSRNSSIHTHAHARTHTDTKTVDCRIFFVRLTRFGKISASSVTFIYIFKTME